MSKRILMTGASSGIGAASAELFIAAGDEVVSLDIKAAPAGVSAHFHCDMSDPASIDAALARLDGEFDALLNIAGVYEDQENAVEAEDFYQRAATEFEDIGDAGNFLRAVRHLGTLHENTGNLEAAIAAHERALEVFVDLGDSHGQARVMFHIGNLWLDHHDIDRARASLEKAIEFFDAAGDEIGKRESINQMAIALAESGALPDAVDLLRQAVEINADGGRAHYDLACFYGRAATTCHPGFDETPERLIEIGLDELKKAVDHGWDAGEHMDSDPDMEPFRELAAYQELRDRIAT